MCQSKQKKMENINNINTKQCIKCNNTLPIYEFPIYKRKSGKIQKTNECIECKRKRQRGRKGQKNHIKYGAEYMREHRNKCQVKKGIRAEHNGKYFTIGLKSVLHRNFCNFCTRVSIDKNIKKYCSDECNKQSQLAGIRLKRLINRINGIPNNYKEKKCIDCNRLFKRNGKRCEQCSDLNKKILRDKAKVSRRSRIKIKAENVNKYKVFKKDNWTCQMCKIKVQKKDIYAPDAAELDHIIPISKGGTHTWDNVQTLCRTCNQFKSDKMPDDLKFEKIITT